MNEFDSIPDDFAEDMAILERRKIHIIPMTLSHRATVVTGAGYAMVGMFTFLGMLAVVIALAG